MLPLLVIIAGLVYTCTMLVLFYATNPALLEIVMTKVTGVPSSRWHSSDQTLFFELERNKNRLSAILNSNVIIRNVNEVPKAETYPQRCYDYFLTPQLAGIPSLVIFSVTPEEDHLSHTIRFSTGVIEGESRGDILKLPAKVFHNAGVPVEFSDTYYVSHHVANDALSPNVNALAIRGIMAFDKRKNQETFGLLKLIMDDPAAVFSQTNLKGVAHLFKSTTPGQNALRLNLLRFYSTLAFVPTDVYEMNTRSSKALARPLRAGRFLSAEIIGREFSRFSAHNRAILPSDPGHPKQLKSCLNDLLAFKKRVSHKSYPYVVSGVAIKPDDPEQESAPKCWVLPMK
jgi:hypothetical protein